MSCHAGVIFNVYVTKGDQSLVCVPDSTLLSISLYNIEMLLMAAHAAIDCIQCCCSIMHMTAAVLQSWCLLLKEYCMPCLFPRHACGRCQLLAWLNACLLLCAALNVGAMAPMSTLSM